MKTELPSRGTITVFSETEDYIILYKAAGIPSAPLKNGTYSAFEMLAETRPELKTVKGKKAGEYGLLHRIDTETQGLLLVAKNDSFFEAALHEQNAGGFIKHYTAYCTADAVTRLSKLPLVIESRFRPFGADRAMVKPVFPGAGRADEKKAGVTVYRTTILEAALLNKEDFRIVRVIAEISAGYRHQVRAHLASTGCPVIGDSLYNSQRNCEAMLFFASGIDIPALNVHSEVDQPFLDSFAIRSLTSLQR